MACSVAAVGDGTQAQLAPACGWPIFWSSMSAIRSGAAHMPLPIWARPAKPAGQADVDVPVLVGLDPALLLHVALRTIGPACIDVWISSPVRSRKPVLMNATRDVRGTDALAEVDASCAAPRP